MIKINKKWGSLCLFSRHYANKYSYLGPFGKNRAQPKTRQKGEIFDDACGTSFDFWDRTGASFKMVWMDRAEQRLRLTSAHVYRRERSGI